MRAHAHISTYSSLLSTAVLFTRTWYVLHPLKYSPWVRTYAIGAVDRRRSYFSRGVLQKRTVALLPSSSTCLFQNGAENVEAAPV